MRRRKNPSGPSPVLIIGGVVAVAGIGYLLFGPHAEASVPVPTPSPEPEPESLSPGSIPQSRPARPTSPSPLPPLSPPLSSPVPASAPLRPAITTQSDKLYIRNLQRQLNTLGLLGTLRNDPVARNAVVTGFLDHATQVAVRVFQDHQHLPITGMVDGTTATRINWLYERFVAENPDVYGIYLQLE